MRLNTAPTHAAEVSNGVTTTQFQMRANAKSFSILSNSLYSNKIRAIVRELGTNAYDSHVLAGCPERPFEVHLPNKLEPWFAVRDFGVGLSAEQVEKIYTVYFESTKDTSNDFNGCLGLGSKSPFSYTTNFTVSSVKDGVRNLYSAFIDDTGCPAIAKLHTCETTDPNGIEVKFPVNTDDFRSFLREAENVYGVFKTPPTITGVASNTVTLYKPSRVYEDIIPGLHLIESNGYYSSLPYTRSFAVMGNVAYPIDLPEYETETLNAVEQAILKNCEIHFENGEIEFQPSREGLSYIPRTVAAIKSKLEQAANQLSAKVYTDLAAIPNKWDRTVEAFKIARKSEVLRSTVKTFNVSHPDLLLPFRASFYSDDAVDVSNLTEVVEQLVRYEESTRSRRETVSRFTYDFKYDQVYIYPSAKAEFIEMPTRSKDITRLRNYINRDRVVYAVQLKEGCTLEQVTSLLGDPPTITLDDLPELPATTVQRTKSTGVSLIDTDGRTSAVSVDVDNGVVRYYIPMKNKKYCFTKLFTDTPIYQRDFAGSLAKISAKLFNGYLYSVNSVAIKEVQENEIWINLEDALVDWCNNNTLLLQRIAANEEVHRVGDQLEITQVFSDALGDRFKDSVFGQVRTILEAKLVSEHDFIQSEIISKHYTDVVNTVNTIFNKYHDELNKFPLVSPTVKSSSSYHEPLVEYVQALVSKNGY